MNTPTFDVVFQDGGYAVIQVGRGYKPFRAAWFKSRDEAETDRRNRQESA